MYEQSKAAKRRYNDGKFHSRYFVGKGVDIGGAPDPLSQYVGLFARLEQVDIWDWEQGDAQEMAGVADDSYDFVHASHCLEHLVDVYKGMENWIRVVKPGGYLVITIPDEDMYEQGCFPSRFNADHKWTFTICKDKSWSPKSINVLDLIKHFAGSVEVERVLLLNDFHREDLASIQFDQTLTPVAESAIEFVLRKRME